MKRGFFPGVILILAIIAAVFISNIKVATRQGLNYALKVKKIPLYYKILGFTYRHFSYKQIVKDIVKDAGSEEEKVLKIFKWTHENIKRVPENFPVVDDHILNIIIRGYGMCDQSQDVFATLCNYAGIDATWVFVTPENSQKRFTISLVKLDGEWKVFDSYFGYYFKNRQGEIASLEDIINDIDLVDQIKDRPVFAGVSYKEYFKGLEKLDRTKIDTIRFRQQIPAYRFTNAVKRLIKR